MFINFLKSIFTWWSSQTVGTFFFTTFFGSLVGKDEFGNKYYKNKNDSKRWVIYNGEVESSRIPPEWHLWIHKTSNSTPDKINFVNHSWIKNHHENYTGSDMAYSPLKKSKIKEETYKKWHPEQ
ncbi:MAG: NADH-ubiquinone oxidoreductase subunit NDUFA12 family protein [Pelagibacteraceae bacterium]